MTIRNTCEILNLNEVKGRHTWQFIAPLKQARHSHASCSYGDTVYISGGTSNKGIPLNDLLCIRPTDKNVFWTTLKPMLSARSEHCMVKANSNQILIVGGIIGNYEGNFFKVLSDSKSGDKLENNNNNSDNNNGSTQSPVKTDNNKNNNNNNNNLQPKGTIDSYNPMNNSWSRLQNIEGENVKISESTTENERISDENRRVAHKQPNISCPRFGVGASELAQASATVYWSGKIMIFGGWNAGKLGRFDHNEKLWLYDIKSGRWEQAGGIPSKLRAASLSCFFNTKNV